MIRFVALCAFLVLSACAGPRGVFVTSDASHLGGSLYIEPVDQQTFYLVLDGPISPETSFSFLAMLESTEIEGLIIAQSVGGNLLASHQIGDAIRDNGLNVLVLGGCYSACVDIFIAGSSREMMTWAELGMHPASNREIGYEVNKVYWARMGFPEVNEAVYRRQTDELWIVPAARARELRMATEIIEE